MILFTTATGPHVELQRLAAAHHAGLFPDVLQLHYTEPPPAPFKRHWTKVWHLKRLFDTSLDGEQIAYFDCDVLAVQSFNLAGVLPDDKDFAAVRNAWGQYNTGVMFWRVNERSRRVVDLVLKTHQSGQTEQPAINAYINTCRHYSLSARYNAYSYALGDKANPYIRAWHGLGPERALREMAQWLKNESSRLNA